MLEQWPNSESGDSKKNTGRSWSNQHTYRHVWGGFLQSELSQHFLHPILGQNFNGGGHLIGQGSSS